MEVWRLVKGWRAPAGYDVWSDGWQGSLGLITNQTSALNAM